MSEQTILEHVQAVNAANPSYAHVLAELVVVLPVDEASAIPKTSKGSVIRPKALQVFADAIDEAYRRLESGQQGPADGMSSASKLVDVNDEAALTNYVRGAIRQALGGYRVNGAATKVVGDDDDLFNAGIDSVRAVSIRGALQQVRFLRKRPMRSTPRLILSIVGRTTVWEDTSEQHRTGAPNHYKVRISLILFSTCGHSLLSQDSEDHPGHFE